MRTVFFGIWMKASNDLIFFRCGHIQRRQWVWYVTASWALYHMPWYTPSHWVIRLFPLCGVKALHPAQYDLTRPPAMVTAKKKQYLGCPAHAVIGVFNRVVANRRQPYSYTIYL